MLPQEFSFSDRELDKIDTILQQLYWDTEAQCLLVADTSGQLVSVLGQTEMNTAVLSALAAGNLAATKEMARLVGEQARFKLLLHEGEKQSIYLSDIGEEMILITVFGNQIPIGLVRWGIQVAVRKLMEIITEARADKQELPTELRNSLADGLNSSWESFFNV